MTKAELTGNEEQRRIQERKIALNNEEDLQNIASRCPYAVKFFSYSEQVIVDEEGEGDD